MLIADIISTADSRTEKRGGKALNLANELLLVLQAFCKTQPWGWRLKSTMFSTVANTPEYMLPADGVGGTCEVDSIYSVQIVQGSTDIIGLDPVNEEADKARRQNVDATDQPSNYFRKLGDITMVRLSPIPDNVYPIVLAYYAVPQAALGSALPPYFPQDLSGILVKGLEMTILRYTLGVENEKYTATKEEYDGMVQQAWEG